MEEGWFSSSSSSVGISFTSSSSANVNFISSSQLSLTAGNLINHISNSLTMRTGQFGALTLSSAGAFTINTINFSALGGGEYTYIRGFEGLSFSAPNILFTGVVTIFANDRNGRTINRDKDLVFSASQAVSFDSETIFFANVDIPNDSVFIIPNGNPALCSLGQFYRDNGGGANIIRICGTTFSVQVY